MLQGSGFLKFVKHQHKPLLMEAHKKIRLNWTNEVMDSEIRRTGILLFFPMKGNLIWMDQMAINIIGTMSEDPNNILKKKFWR